MADLHLLPPEVQTSLREDVLRVVRLNVAAVQAEPSRYPGLFTNAVLALGEDVDAAVREAFEAALATYDEERALLVLASPTGARLVVKELELGTVQRLVARARQAPASA